MTEPIRKALERLKETVNDLESLDRSHWNASLGTGHLTAYAEQLVNDAKTVAVHLKSFGK